MARLNLSRPRTLGILLAVASLAFAACSKSGSTPVPIPTGTFAATPIPSSIPSNLVSACSSSFGVAYEPDGGNGAGFAGVQVVHFEDASGALCAATPAPNVTPASVAFASSVGGLAFASDLTDAVALLRNASGSYTLAQDVFGASIASLVPVGAPYDLSMNPPTPTPTTSASASPSGATPTPTTSPSNAPLLSDAQSIAILGASSSAVALTTGTAAAGSPDAIVALTSLTNAPPQYGSDVPFSGSGYTLKTIPNVPRSTVRVAASSDSAGNVRVTALARGPQDLLAFNVTTVGSGYQFDAQADDTTLGSGAALRGNGAVTLDPFDVTRALVGGTSNGTSTQLTLVTGLPAKITLASTLALPGNIRSIALTANGSLGVIGTDVGIVVVKGVDTGTLSIVPAFAPNASSPSASAPTYRTCSGATATLTDVSSVGLSADARYLVALGTSPGVSCPSGYNASIVAVPFSQSSGGTPSPAPASSASPAPTSFVQNNVIAPPVGADYLIVH